MPAVKYIDVGDKEFEVASEDARILTEYIHKVWVKAGRPDRLDSEISWKVVDVIMQVWAAGYPEEFLEWKAGVQEAQSQERTVHEAEKDDGGHFPLGYPTRVFQMLKVYFATEKLQDRKIVKIFANRYPFLKITKYHI